MGRGHSGFWRRSPPPTPVEVQPSGQKRGQFKNLCASQEEEDAFNFAKFRGIDKPSGLFGSIAHLVKGALGGGILSGHVAFMKAGIYPAIILTMVFGIYIGYSLYVLVRAAQIVYKRTRVPIMSYPDVGEAAMACFPNKKVARWSSCFRYTIDFVICLDLFGSCACYQLIIAKTVKQLYENTQETTLGGLYDPETWYPSLRIYLVGVMFLTVLICLIRHLTWLAPFSILANIFIVVCIGMTVYYATQNNPYFLGLSPYNSPYLIIEYLGMSVFSMSCAGVVLPVSNNMHDPSKYGLVVFVGMVFIILFVYLVSIFGYVGYLEKCESPITVNFPLTDFPKIMKALIAFMIYVTHALNFWVPFNLVFYYLKSLHKPERHVMMEYIYRAIIVIIIGCCAIIMPTINNLMGFLGAFCLSFMAFIWPAFIEMLVLYERPGYGAGYWRFWKCLMLIIVGFFLLIVGTYVNANEMAKVFTTDEPVITVDSLPGQVPQAASGPPPETMLSSLSSLSEEIPTSSIPTFISSSTEPAPEE